MARLRSIRPAGEPRVAVIMTCYNEGPYIGAAVRSVLDQSRADMIDAIVIADDGSDPATVATLSEIERWDARIKVLYGQGGVGLPGQRRLAIAETEAPVLAILDGDDLWTPDKLAKQVPVLIAQPEVGLVYADFYVFPNEDLRAARRAGVRNITGSEQLARAYFLGDPPIIPSTTLLRRAAYEACGGFDATVRIFEDTDFYLRLARVTRFALVDAPLLYKRQRGSSITGGRKDLMAHHAFVALKAAADDPALLPLVPERLAERARKLANQRFLLGDRAGARAFSRFAVRLRPSSAGGWLGYALARLPAGAGARLRRTLFKRRVAALMPPQPDRRVEERETRILYVINGFNRGGAEKGLLHLLRGGAFAGCSVRIVSIVAGQGAYVEELRAGGATVEHLAGSAGMGIGQWLLAVPRLWRIMAGYRPDCVILSLPQANIAGRLASLLYRQRCVVASFEHNTHLAKKLYERLFRWTSPRVDWMLADCATTAKEAGDRLYRSPPPRTAILPLVSVASAPLDPRSPAVRPFTIVSAGRFTAVKNHHAMIEAVALLRTRGVTVQLILFGEGELQAVCEAQAANLQVDDLVDFRGFVTDWAQTPADAFLLASRHEGLCIVAIEAMSRGMPVIAPRVGGLRDYGEEAKVLLLDDVAPETIADAVARLRSDSALHADMRAAGLRTVQERFSEATVGRVYAGFAEIVKTSSLLRARQPHPIHEEPEHIPQAVKA